MRALSKSKIMAFRQCPRRIWLEVHRPELKQEDARTHASYQAGHAVGELARNLFDPLGRGCLIDAERLGFPAVFQATQQALSARRPIFEAAFTTGDALALADILLPVGSDSWRMVEVKSSTAVKSVHREDLALQVHVARRAGLHLQGASIARIDKTWIHPGEARYDGLLVEEDLSSEVLGRGEYAQGWIDGAQRVAAEAQPPRMSTGAQCTDPYPCGFRSWCDEQEPPVEMPIEWLPHLKAGRWRQQGIRDMREIPAESLRPSQRRVRDCTVDQAVFFDQEGARRELARHPLPGYFLDFESVQFAVPIWAGTRPYQQIPFQFSLRFVTPEVDVGPSSLLDGRAGMDGTDFLDLSGEDPSRRLAESLIESCGEAGPVFVYNAGFERSCIRELGERFPDLRGALGAIDARIVDLLPIARKRYYAPSQRGSWSIKDVLPAAVPGLSYEQLEGVRGGGGAQEAFLEAITPETTAERREALRRQLLDYCRLDTYAMVKLWEVFSGHVEWRL
jgi:hypothetical protein